MFADETLQNSRTRGGVADTRVEDPDLWRFATQAAEHIGVPLTVVADGRTPFEVFADQRFLGNSRLAPCSIHLKQRPCRRWLRENTDPADTVLYVGIDWSERHRTGTMASLARGVPDV